MKLEANQELAFFLRRHLRLSRHQDYDGETIVSLEFVWVEDDGIEEVVVINSIGLNDQP